MDTINDLTKIIGQLDQTVKKLFDQTMSPEIQESMTEEQKKLLEEGRNAFDLSGVTLEEKMEKLQNTIKHVAKYSQ